MLRRQILALLISISSFTLSIAQVDEVGSGRAIRFDGIDDYIDLGNIYDDLTYPFTVSAWVKIDPGGGGPIFVSQDNEPIYNGFWFFVADDHAWIEYGDGQGENNPRYRRGRSTQTLFLAGRWIHLCAVVKGRDDIRMYLNGIDVTGSVSGESNLPMKSNYPNSVAKIGYFKRNNVYYHFKGAIDEVQLWNLSLTESEIRGNMCRKLTGNEPGLIGYWPFNYTSGDIVYDKSIDNYNGQFVFTPMREFSGAPIGDESIPFYKPLWDGKDVYFEHGSVKFTIYDIVGDPEGLQFYIVDDFPSQAIGLESVENVQFYIGVYSASTVTGKSFRVTIINQEIFPACSVFRRSDNSVAAWEEVGQMVNFVDRTELVWYSPYTTTEIDLGVDESVCPFVPKILQPVDDAEGKTFMWQDGSVASTYLATDYGTYWVRVLTDNCEFAYDTVTFEPPEKATGFIPNIFTPNGDDMNEYFEVAEPLLGSKLVVYNKWGKEVFRSKNYDNNWNGSQLPAGVYYYRIEGPCIVEKKGWVAITY